MSDQHIADKGLARIMVTTYLYKQAIGEDSKTWFREFYTSLTKKIGYQRAENIKAMMSVIKNEEHTAQPETSPPAPDGTVAEDQKSTV